MRTYSTFFDSHKSHTLPTNLELRLKRFLNTMNLDEHNAQSNYCAFCEPTHRANLLLRALVGTLLEFPTSGEIIEGTVVK